MGVEKQEFLILFGVWIQGRGWLKNEQGKVFTDPRPEVARTAVLLWGPGASVLPIDPSLVDLEAIFLEREKQGNPLWRILTRGK